MSLPEENVKISISGMDDFMTGNDNQETTAVKEQIPEKPVVEVKRRFPPAGALIGLVFFALLILVGWFVIWGNSDKEKFKVDEHLKQINEEMDTAISMTPEKNAWLDYEEALESFTLPDVKKMEYILENGISIEDMRFVDKAMKDNSKTLAVLDGSLKKTNFQINYDCRKEPAPGNYPPDMDRLGRMAQFMVMTAFHQGQMGCYDEAVKRYVQALKLGEGLRKNSSLVIGSVGLQITRMTLSSLKIFLANQKGQSDIYSYLTGEMEKISQDGVSPGGMLGADFVSSMLFFDKVLRGEQKADGVDYSAKKELVAEERDRYIEWYRARYRLGADSFDKYAKISGQKNEKTLNGTLLRYVILPGTDYFFSRYYRAEVEFRGTMILSAVKWYEGKTGHLPESMDELVPKYLSALPEDPFAKDRSFRYKSKGVADVSIHSVGEDGKDEDGQNISLSPSEPGDIVIVTTKKK